MGLQGLQIVPELLLQYTKFADKAEGHVASAIDHKCVKLGEAVLVEKACDD